MTRKIGYVWHLRRLMAEHGMFATTDLGPLLAERGVSLSREQVYRLVTRTPERLSLATLAALCDILGCHPGDLVEPVAPSRAPGSRGRPGRGGHGSCRIPARADDGRPGAGVPGRSPARSAQTRPQLSRVPQGHCRGPGRSGRPVADRGPGR
jgi:DNA-binding Xre family transcriptional regulator